MRISRMENPVFVVFLRMLFVFRPVVVVFLSGRVILPTGVVKISHSYD